MDRCSRLQLEYLRWMDGWMDNTEMCGIRVNVAFIVCGENAPLIHAGPVSRFLPGDCYNGSALFSVRESNILLYFRDELLKQS